MSFVAVVAGAGAVYGGISANQKYQAAKGAQGQALNTATTNYDARAPLRSQALSTLENGAAPDYTTAYTAPVSALQTQATDAQGKSLASLTNGPDYYAQAAQKLKDFDTQSAPQLAAAYRTVGQNASTLGRLGDEGVGTSLGNVTSDYLRNRQTAEDSYLQDAQNAGRADQYNQLGAENNIANAQFSQGQALLGNKAAQLAAQRAAQGQTFSQGVSLANLGFGNTDQGAYQTAADRAQTQADQENSDAGRLAASAAQIYANSQKPKTTS